jgi:hypothetical protein
MAYSCNPITWALCGHCLQLVREAQPSFNPSLVVWTLQAEMMRGLSAAEAIPPRPPLPLPGCQCARLPARFSGRARGGAVKCRAFCRVSPVPNTRVNSKIRSAVDGAGDPESAPGRLQVDLKKAIILQLAHPIVRNLQCHMGPRLPRRSSVRVQSFRSRTERPIHC